ncbi:MAG: DUF1232 domain-containing protein [Syntrophomonadaceae bacterium]|nr:DUF1232 domain-containing protein [Syntrophomonadaceae bacterium]
MSKDNENEKRIHSTVQQTILLIPNFLKLLYRLTSDRRVPLREKAILFGAVAYILSPLDFLPDVIPVLGQIDDLLLIALILQRFMNSVDRRVVLEHWDGWESLLVTIEKILEFTRYLLPAGIYEKVVHKARPQYIDADYEIK